MLFVLICQFFTSGMIDFLPVFVINWGILLTALGFGNEPAAVQKILFSMIFLQGLILFVVAASYVYRDGIHHVYLINGLIGIITAFLAFAGYLVGGRKT